MSVFHNLEKCLAVGLASLLTVLIGCSNGGSASDRNSQAQPDIETTTTTLQLHWPREELPPDLHQAIGESVSRAGWFSMSQLDQIDLPSAMIFDYVNRNWQVSELDNVYPWVQEQLASTLELPAEAQVLNRLMDPSSLPVTSLPDGEWIGPTSELLGRVLHCDSMPLTEDDFRYLDYMVKQGGYEATHAGLAIGWMDELQCDYSPSLRHAAVTTIHVELKRKFEVTDLSLEQIAILGYLDAGGLIDHDWLRETIAHQQDDGRWSDAEAPTDWHTTLMGMWSLLTARDGGGGVPMVWIDRS